MPDGKPNILVIWGDDIGISNLSCYSDGLMGYRTPNIDRIANEGMRFTDSYGEQSCTAGRAAFISGQSVYRTGMSKVGVPGADVGWAHAPVAGTRIAFAGLDSGFPGNAGATTAATGRYTFPALPIGPYPYLIAGGAGGYERSVVTPFALAAGAPVRDLARPAAVGRWRAEGGRSSSSTGSDFTSFDAARRPSSTAPGNRLEYERRRHRDRQAAGGDHGEELRNRSAGDLR